MNAQKYTQKSLEAIQAAQQLTIENQKQQIEQVHLLASLIRQENGLAPQLLRSLYGFERFLRIFLCVHKLHSILALSTFEC